MLWLIAASCVVVLIGLATFMLYLFTYLQWITPQQVKNIFQMNTTGPSANEVGEAPKSPDAEPSAIPVVPVVLPNTIQLDSISVTDAADTVVSFEDSYTGTYTLTTDIVAVRTSAAHDTTWINTSTPLYLWTLDTGTGTPALVYYVDPDTATASFKLIGGTGDIRIETVDAVTSLNVQDYTGQWAPTTSTNTYTVGFTTSTVN